MTVRAMGSQARSAGDRQHRDLEDGAEGSFEDEAEFLKEGEDVMGLLCEDNEKAIQAAN